jgi:hypothetical protein
VVMRGKPDRRTDCHPDEQTRHTKNDLPHCISPLPSWQRRRHGEDVTPKEGSFERGSSSHPRAWLSQSAGPDPQIAAAGGIGTPRHEPSRPSRCRRCQPVAAFHPSPGPLNFDPFAPVLRPAANLVRSQGSTPCVTCFRPSS